jgi:hypothetical protein
MPAFREVAMQFISGIKTDLQTDQDFADADTAVKFCEKAEKDLEQAKTSAIAQTASIDELLRTVDFIKDQLRAKRLELSKLVSKRKDEIRALIISEAKLAFTEHVVALEAEIDPIRVLIAIPDFAAAAKNKRTLNSLHDAVDSELARGKIAADAIAKDYRVKIAWCKDEAGNFLFLLSDMQHIIQKPLDDLKLLVTTRIDAHKAKQAAEEARIKAQAVAEADAAREKATRDAAELEASEIARLAKLNSTLVQPIDAAEEQARKDLEAVNAIGAANAKAFAVADARIDVSAITGIYPTPKAVVNQYADSTITTVRAHSATRIALNKRLDMLNEEQLQRILNFVISRYSEQAA